jgi:hypothetical protein
MTHLFCKCLAFRNVFVNRLSNIVCTESALKAIGYNLNDRQIVFWDIISVSMVCAPNPMP